MHTDFVVDKSQRTGVVVAAAIFGRTTSCGFPHFQIALCARGANPLAVRHNPTHQPSGCYVALPHSAARRIILSSHNLCLKFLLAYITSPAKCQPAVHIATHHRIFRTLFFKLFGSLHLSPFTDS